MHDAVKRDRTPRHSDGTSATFACRLVLLPYLVLSIILRLEMVPSALCMRVPMQLHPGPRF